MSPGLDAIPPLLTEVERVAGLEKITPMELLERLMGVYEEMEDEDLPDPRITADHSYDDDEHQPSNFRRAIQRASEVVRTWPAWKQEVLGGTAVPNNPDNSDRDYGGRPFSEANIDMRGNKGGQRESER